MPADLLGTKANQGRLNRGLTRFSSLREERVELLFILETEPRETHADAATTRAARVEARPVVHHDAERFNPTARKLDVKVESSGDRELHVGEEKPACGEVSGLGFDDATDGQFAGVVVEYVESYAGPRTQSGGTTLGRDRTHALGLSKAWAVRF